MRFTTSTILVLGLLAAGSARANSEQDQSRAFQLARRVASLENQQDVPSRAMWLSNRVVENNRTLAFDQSRKPSSKKLEAKE